MIQTQEPRSQAQLQFLAMWPWASPLIAVVFSCLTCKNEDNKPPSQVLVGMILGTWYGTNKPFSKKRYLLTLLPFPQNKNKEASIQCLICLFNKEAIAQWSSPYLKNAQHYSLTNATSVMPMHTHCDFKNAWEVLLLQNQSCPHLKFNN